ncbi:TonB-dependent receptor plug domain-containing protein [Thiomicrospira sp. XS5]|uniref:TonB-dependent receptor plug domain-containing protein n=1 Tax=Thiomicrospira sp. XS5 TaxID=1775636 RepID=UPI000AAE948D|nr:TonB-dependent receptor plug domain-containing protein [Thiomicrospira sp. XS5]
MTHYQRILLGSSLWVLPVYDVIADELPTVVVQGETEEHSLSNDSTSQSGKSVLSEEVLKAMPKGNGNMNEALRIVPEVELNDSSMTSTQAGEIKPGEVSILGGRAYQNNFIVDGSPNNSILDPASDSNGIGSVAGHSQEMFLNLDLIESIDVYSSNVPAKYGRFGGGVIDAKTKRAKFDFTGRISGRYTSDAMTQFHVPEETDFELSNSASQAQPKFDKQNYNLFINTPINEDTAFYINYDRTSSNIPVLHLGETVNEKRELDNILAKVTHYFNDDHVVDASFTYAPYTETRYLTTTANSQYDIEGGGYKFNLDFEDRFDVGVFKTTASYNQSYNRRFAPDDYYRWAPTDTFPWGRVYSDGVYSKEGGYGDLDSQQNRTYLKSDFEGKEYSIGNWLSQFNAGAELDYVSAYKKRPNDTHNYVVGNDASGLPEAGLSNLRCNGTDACVEGEQYAVGDINYGAGQANADIMNVGTYLEDILEYERLMLRLGLRYDYNDFMENHDVAYRTFGKFDLFGGKKVFLTGGMNRYYANTFLTYKLRQAGLDYQQYTRGATAGYDAYGQKVITPDAWSLGTGTNEDITRYSELNTPYTDEKSLGVEINVLGGVFVAERVFRNSYDQFVRTTSPVADDGHQYEEMTNDGWSKYDSWKLEWRREWTRHLLQLSFFIGEGEKNFLDNYDDEVDDGVNTAEIYYNGETIPISQMGKIKDPNPGTVKLYYSYLPQENLQLGVYAFYKDGYTRFEQTGAEHVEFVQDDGTDRLSSFDIMNEYDYIDYEPYFQMDLSATYRFKISETFLSLTMDVTNVFDNYQKQFNKSSGSYDYVLGRQIWLGAAYDW